MLKQRLGVHISHAKKGKEANNSKTKAIVSANYEVEILSIEEAIIGRELAFQREQFWINFYKDGGHPLTNKRSSGWAQELDCLIYIANGYRAKEIGSILNISGRAVESHLMNMRKRLGAVNNPNLIKIAWNKGILNDTHIV